MTKTITITLTNRQAHMLSHHLENGAVAEEEYAEQLNAEEKAEHLQDVEVIRSVAEKAYAIHVAWVKGGYHE